MQLMRMRRHYRHKSRRKWCRAAEITGFYGKTGALNSNMMSDFKPEVVMRSKLRVPRIDDDDDDEIC